MEGTMTEIVGNAIAPESDAGGNSDTARPSEGTIETQLTEEITNLWSDHVRLSANHKTTARELRQIRASLAERLHAMKNLLSHPGRCGEWRGWLRKRGIPRSTADRLAARHAETLGTATNVPTGAIPEPPSSAAENLAKAAWPRIKKVLATDASVVQFLASIAEISGVAHEWREEGLMVFNPAPKAADELPGSASANGPAPQPSTEACAVAEEPAAEVVATNPTSEALAAAADASSVQAL